MESKLFDKLNFLTDFHWTCTFSIYIAYALMAWIQIQMMMLNSVSWSHTLYLFTAGAIIFIALLTQVRKFYQK